MSTRNRFIYLASPYSHPNPAVRNERYRAVRWTATVLLQKGYMVFSPIVHSHPLTLRSDVPTDWEFWAEQDKRMLAATDALYVLTLPGWEESQGVLAELRYAVALGKPVHFVSEVSVLLMDNATRTPHECCKEAESA